MLRFVLRLGAARRMGGPAPFVRFGDVSLIRPQQVRVLSFGSAVANTPLTHVRHGYPRRSWTHGNHGERADGGSWPHRGVATAVATLWRRDFAGPGPAAGAGLAAHPLPVDYRHRADVPGWLASPGRDRRGSVLEERAVQRLLGQEPFRFPADARAHKRNKSPPSIS